VTTLAATVPPAFVSPCASNELKVAAHVLKISTVTRSVLPPACLIIGDWRVSIETLPGPIDITRYTCTRKIAMELNGKSRNQPTGEHL
jgi:hypothetical protein